MEREDYLGMIEAGEESKRHYDTCAKCRCIKECVLFQEYNLCFPCFVSFIEEGRYIMKRTLERQKKVVK